MKEAAAQFSIIPIFVDADFIILLCLRLVVRARSAVLEPSGPISVPPILECHPFL